MTQTSAWTKTNFKQTFRISSLLVIEVQQSHHMKFSIDFIQQVAWPLLARLYRVFSIVYLHYLNELIKKLDYYLENNHICLSTFLYTYLLTYYLSVYLTSSLFPFILLSIHPSAHLSFFPSFLPSFLPYVQLSIYLARSIQNQARL